MDSYDLISYPAMPLPRSHPHHLATLARLLGLSPAPAEKCRVLELGCANGGNLIPMAARLPDSTFVGIERSRLQAARGQMAVAGLQLTNCQIIEQDLMTYEGEEAPFDYIIAHGLYSWAPPPVRQRLLAMCGRLLAPQGLAMVSFNSLPGWHMRGMLREMLLDHCQSVQNPLERLFLAQEFLEKYLAAMEESDALVARHLVVEIRRLLTDNPAYLYHEYLAEENQPVLFRTFARQAAQEGLNHLCDADPTYWYPDVIGQRGSELLESKEDPLEREQYLDFLMVRNFREAVLCRQEVAIKRDLELSALEGLALFASLRPPTKLMLNNNNAQTFLSSTGGKVGVSHPLSRAALVLLWENAPLAMDWPALCRQAGDMVNKAAPSQRSSEFDHMAAELVSLFLRGEVGLTSRKDAMVPSLAEYPQLTPLAKAFNTEGWFATRHHTPLTLDAMASRLFNLLDGSRDMEAMAQAMIGPDAPPDSGKIISQLRRLRPWIAEQLTTWNRLGLMQKG